MSLSTRWSRFRGSLVVVRCVVYGAPCVKDARAIASLTLLSTDERLPTTISHHDTKTPTWLLSTLPRIPLPSSFSRDLSSCSTQENHGPDTSNNTSATHKFEANKRPDVFDSSYSNQVLQDLLADRDADDYSPELLTAMNAAIKLARKKDTTMRSSDHSLYRDLSSWMPYLEADATPTRGLAITFATLADAQKLREKRETASQELRVWLDFASAAANACRLFSEPSYRRTDDAIKGAMKAVDDTLHALLQTVNEMESNQRQQRRVAYELLRVVRLKHEETRLGEYLAVLDELLNDRDAFEERSSYERLFRKLSLLGRDAELDELLVHMKNSQRLFEPKTTRTREDGAKKAAEEAEEEGKDFRRLNTQLYWRLLKSKNTALIRRKLLEEFASLVQENATSSSRQLLPVSLSSEMVAQITGLLRSPSVVVNSDWELADRLMLDYIQRYNTDDHHDRNRDYNEACGEWLASYMHDTTKQQWIVSQMIDSGILPSAELCDWAAARGWRERRYDETLRFFEWMKRLHNVPVAECVYYHMALVGRSKRGCSSFDELNRRYEELTQAWKQSRPKERGGRGVWSSDRCRSEIREELRDYWKRCGREDKVRELDEGDDEARQPLSQ